MHLGENSSTTRAANTSPSLELSFNRDGVLDYTEESGLTGSFIIILHELACHEAYSLLTIFLKHRKSTHYIHLLKPEIPLNKK